MTTVARIVDGYAVDVCVTPPALSERFASAWLAQQTFYNAPDGTNNGRPGTVNPDGSVTWGANPSSPPAPAPVPRVLNGADWKDYAYGVLGALVAPAGTDQEKALAGLRRYGAILKAARASVDDGVVGALDQYDDAVNFRKDKVEMFLAVLMGAGIVTLTEYNAIADNWPTL